MGGSGYTEVTLQQTVTRTATLTWQGGTPPDHVWLKVYAWSHWDAYAYPSGTLSGTADNGKRDAVVPVTGGGNSEGTHLVWADSSSGTVSVTATMAQSMTASGTQNTQGELDYMFTVAIDDRGVQITRTGGRGEWFEPNGTGHGDTVYSYVQNCYSVDPPTISNVQTLQDFSTSYEGSWPLHLVNGIMVPNAAWTWNPDCDGDGQFNCTWPMQYGTRESNVYITGTEWSGPLDDPTEASITYTAKDSADGAQCTAHYVLTLHDPYEFNSTDTEKPDYLNERQVGGQVIQNDPTGQRPWSLSYSGTVGYSVGVVFATGEAVGKWLCDLLGISFSVTHSGSTTCTESTTVTDLPYEHRTWLEAVDVYARHTGTADTWDAAGWAGPQDYDVDEPVAPYTPALRVHRPYAYP